MSSISEPGVKYLYGKCRLFQIENTGISSKWLKLQMRQLKKQTMTKSDGKRKS